MIFGTNIAICQETKPEFKHKLKSKIVSHTRFKASSKSVLESSQKSQQKTRWQKVKLFGFTLAEVLIVLGIIGVVAEMTLPTLINNTKDKELKVAAKKALSMASQAYMMNTVNTGESFGGYTHGTTTSYNKFNAMKNNLKIIKECSYGTTIKGECWAANGVGKPNVLVSSCNRCSNTSGTQGKNESFVTADGMFYMLYSYSATTGADVFFIDTNGLKGPNNWGKDVFIFDMLETIRPYNYTPCKPVKNDGSIYNLSTENLAPFLNK